jgi:hypothetical protein
VIASFDRRKSQKRISCRNVATAAFALTLGLGAARVADAQDAKSQNQTTNKPSHSQVPEIVVTAAKSKGVAKPRRRTTVTVIAAPSPAQNPQPPTEVTAGYVSGGPTLQRTALGDKTGTKIGDLPQSVVTVPRSLAVEQSNLSVGSAISRDVSGVNQGGSSSYGFFDRFTIRGMDARIYEDNFRTAISPTDCRIRSTASTTSKYSKARGRLCSEPVRRAARSTSCISCRHRCRAMG